MRRRNGRPGLLGTMARTAVIAGTATSVSNAKQQAAAQEAAQKQAQAAQLASMQDQLAALQQPPVAAPAPAAPAPVAAAAAGPGGDLMAQLQQLASMHQAGILSEAEFAAAKAKLLG